jgi:hypothetical protein
MDMFEVVAAGSYDPNTDTLRIDQAVIDGLSVSAWAVHPNNPDRTHVRVPVTAAEADLISHEGITGTIMNFDRCDVPEALWHRLRDLTSGASMYSLSYRNVARGLLRKVDHERNGLWS